MKEQMLAAITEKKVQIWHSLLRDSIEWHYTAQQIRLNAQLLSVNKIQHEFHPASLHRLQALQRLVDARLWWSRWLTNSRACNASRKTRDIYLSSIEFEHRCSKFGLVNSSSNYSLLARGVQSLILLLSVWFGVRL